MIHTLAFRIHDLVPYINWLYFFHAWGISPRFASIEKVHDCPSCRKSWVEHFEEKDKPEAAEVERLQTDALNVLRYLDGQFSVYSRFGLFPAWSDGDDIVVLGISKRMDDTLSDISCSSKKVRLPFLRQQSKRNENLPFLCLSDFMAPFDKYYAARENLRITTFGLMPKGTVLGVFASTVDGQMENLFKDDDYKRMLVQTICDRLAEAATEKMHEDVRRKYWGYSPEEQLFPKELFAEKYRGKRPAVGYPSIPDQSVNFLINDLIDMESIGISLTSNGMMQPHASVSGLMFDHPSACHFSVGAIGEDQLRDYALRRGCAVEVCRKFLSGNLR